MRNRHPFICAAAVLSLLCRLCPAAAAEPLTLTLDEAVSFALENNLDLANASLEVSKAELESQIADRRRLPEADAEARYSRFDIPEAEVPQIELPPELGIPDPELSLPDREADVALSATMPLYTGGRLSSASRRASLGLELTREAERIARGDLLLETATSFYELLAAQELVGIAGDALESSRLHLQESRALLDQGLVAQVDLFRSELDTAERERDLASAEANLVRRAETLSSLIFPREHVDLRARWDAPEPSEPPPVEEWIGLAEGSSPEIASSRLSVELAREGVSAARAERMPAVGLFGSWGARAEDFTYRGEDRYWNAGVGLSLPLYRGRRTVLEVDKSKVTERQSVNSLDQARRLVRRGIVDAHAGTILALRQHGAAVKAVRAAEENHRVTKLKYREGLIANTDVIDALLSLSRARFDRIEALKNYYSNRTLLMRLAGTIGQGP